MKSTSRPCVATNCAQTSDSDRFRFCSVMRALKASMPPYCTEYRGGLPPFRMSGRCVSASSSQVVTCARMSRTDQAPVTPGSISCASDRPAYDSLNATHAVSRRFRICRRSMSHSHCRPDSGCSSERQVDAVGTSCSVLGSGSSPCAPVDWYADVDPIAVSALGDVQAFVHDELDGLSHGL